MRTITTDLLGEISGDQATLPVYLVEITLDQPYTLSTAQPLNWNGKSWINGLIGDGTLQATPDNASFAIENMDDRFTAAALNGGFQRQPVKIWWAYGLGEYGEYFEEGYIDDDYIQGPEIGKPELLFSGLISATPEIGMWLRIEATRATPRGYPRLRVRPPIANHLTPSGANIVFGGETYRVETR